MKSGWFFGTRMWNEYLHEYAKTRPECLREWKSSPLADDHSFIEALVASNCDWIFEEHFSQVIDLCTHKWSDIRKSYRGKINQGKEVYVTCDSTDLTRYRKLHREKYGNPRTEKTYDIQQGFANDRLAFCTYGMEPVNEQCVSAALWYYWNGKAYYASGVSTVGDVQHLIVWLGIENLKSLGISHVDMGQIDGEEAGTRGVFKTGFGGEAKPFTIVRRK